MSVCRQCKIGRMQASTAPIVTRVGEQIVVYPLAPIQHCDVCDFAIYDSAFMQTFQTLIVQQSMRNLTASKNVIEVAGIEQKSAF